MTHDGKVFQNHDVRLDNPRLRVKFQKILETRSEKELANFTSKLSATQSEQWLKSELSNLKLNANAKKKK